MADLIALSSQVIDGNASDVGPLTAKGIFGYAAAESLAKAGIEDPHAKR